MRPGHLALEDLQLMAEDHHLHLGVHLFVGRSNDPPDDTAQQQIDDSQEHEPNLPEKGGSMVRRPWSRCGSVGCVPFTLHPHL
jgi:hypothetical protein